ncbi:MAG: hypothetical protein UX36_C0006G0006 [Microgenomates group bacterium GW2011_GWC1_46_15]|nr:MAG: hypothetical protein UX36_C0006G0006 [Microgenomates group bacterium GW2011_GWC1_46_15]
MKSDYINITWTVDDIIVRAKDQGFVRVTRPQARDILEYLERTHDCNAGITWALIDMCINNKTLWVEDECHKQNWKRK